MLQLPPLARMLPLGRAPLLFALRAVPARVHAGAIALGVNRTLLGPTQAARLQPLRGRRVCVHISDAPRSLYWQIVASGLEAAPPGAYDVRISGPLLDLLRLALREEDPDTLFFSRRLSLEGDTELGLHIKNLLDALDYDWRERLAAAFGAKPPR